MAIQIKISAGDSSRELAKEILRHSQTTKRQLISALNTAGFNVRKSLVSRWKNEFTKLSPKTTAALEWKANKLSAGDPGILAVRPKVWNILHWHIEGGVRVFERVQILWRNTSMTKTLRSRIKAEILRLRPLRSAKLKSAKLIKLQTGNFAIFTKEKLSGIVVRKATYKRKASGEDYVDRVAPRLLDEQLKYRKLKI